MILLSSAVRCCSFLFIRLILRKEDIPVYTSSNNIIIRPLSKEVDAMANDFIRESDLDKIKKMTLFDAILFRKAFDLNIPAAEILLRTIMENDKIGSL